MAIQLITKTERIYPAPEILGARLLLRLRALEPIQLGPFPANLFRSALGRALRMEHCVAPDRSCARCVARFTCLYARVFDPQPSPDRTHYQRVSNPPRPMALFVRGPRNAALAPGDTLEFELSLFGSAAQWAPHMVQAVSFMGRSGIGKPPGRFRIATAHSVDPFTGQAGPDLLQPGASTLAQPPAPATLDCARRAALALSGPHGVSLRFLSWFRAKRQGDYVASLDFDTLIRHLARRQAKLFHFYCAFNTPLNFAQYLEPAKSVHAQALRTQSVSMARRSKSQGRSVPMHGVAGQFRFSGPALDAYLLPLVLGQFTHAGKGCTCGLGRYELEPAPAVEE